MSEGNPAYGVGGTAKDGGLSTAATVADGGPDAAQTQTDTAYVPSGDTSRAGEHNTRSTTGDLPSQKKGEGHEGNRIYGVGGTAKDGGMSTAATVSDGGPNDQAPDPTYKPS